VVPNAPAPPPEPAVIVERVAPEDSYPLRNRVLRPGKPRSAVHLAIDHDPATATFAARAPDGEVIGTAIVYPEPCPWLPERAAAWRLRGMATAEGRRGLGIGALVLRAALDHVGAGGGELVWCNARTPARAFYERAGFRPHGEPWDEADIGPHIAMWIDLRPADAAAP
jgi:GNAT superfamily N-acetyltransferase